MRWTIAIDIHTVRFLAKKGDLPFLPSNENTYSETETTENEATLVSPNPILKLNESAQISLSGCLANSFIWKEAKQNHLLNLCDHHWSVSLFHK